MRKQKHRLRFSLRRKLLLLSIAVISLPFVGLEYLREMERFLRDGLETSLLASARAVAGSLHERANLFPQREDGPAALYVHRLRQPVELDGYSDDWLDFLDWSETYSAADSDSLAYRLILAHDRGGLYLLLKVRDDRVIYQRPASGDNRDGDHVQITLQGADGELQQWYFAPAAPGSLRPFRVSEARDAYDHPYTLQHYATHIRGEWQPNGSGYTLEVRLPPADYQGLGVSVHDMDDADTRTLAHNVATAGAATARRPNPLLSSSARIEQLVDFAAADSGRRVWVLNNDAQVLASHGNIRRDLDNPGGRFLYNLILPPPSRYFTDDLAGASRLRGPEVQAALTGQARSRWRASPDGRAVIASAAAPIRVAGDVRGAVVVEETTHQIQMLKRAALASLVNKTLLAYGLVTLLLFVFATRLSLRLRHLNRQAEAAIDEHGRVVGGLQPSRAGDEIGDLSRGYAAMLERLQRYNDYLEGMAGRLAHELRTPLTVVQSSLDNLDGSDAAEREVFIERARDVLRRMNQLVTRLSEAARLEQALQAAEIEPVDLAGLLDSCIQGYRDAYAPREFVYRRPDAPVWLDVSPDLIVQLLDKLVSNANDFATPATPIVIQLEIQGDGVTIAVDNQGPPLPADMDGQLFDSLVSQRSNAQKSGAHLGLGLYLARLIADFHQGRLRAENLKDGAGVRLQLWLPQ